MAKKNESINTSIFAALKVSEVSKVPVLIVSNPGVGKSTTVELFAKIRGYELVMLRGNSSSPEDIMGYDVPKGDKEKAVHTRPTWFDELMENAVAGKKSLLFLDELTTANEYVQAALLHLVFERKCGAEKLPDDTLIVAAGNYFQNLSNTMTVLPPMMNRFMIYNVVPTVNDLDCFLCEFEGSIASPTGDCLDYVAELEKILKDIDSKELAIKRERYNRIGEYIENGIKSTTRRLWTHDKVLDMGVTELNTIYSETDQDSKLRGFITLRTLVYLKRITLAFYKCFGKDGILSKNYKNAVDGLVGLAVSRSSNGEVKFTKVCKEYFDDMAQIINEIEKMENEKLPEYQNYFIDILNDSTTKVAKSKLTIPELQGIINKIEELKRDGSVNKIERPIDGVVLNQLCTTLVATAKEECGGKFKLTAGESIPTETVIKWVNSWNTVSTLMSSVISLTNDPSKGYNDDVTKHVTKIIDDLKKVFGKLRSTKHALILKDGEIANLIPEAKDIVL